MLFNLQPGNGVYLCVGSNHMTASNNFSEYYKTISNSELLTILDNPGQYQAAAVEAAKQEFSYRQLSNEEVQAAKEQIIAEQIQKEKQREKVKAVEDKVKAAGYTLIDTLNPIQFGISSTEKTIRLIVVVFGGLFIYQFIKDFHLHWGYITDISRFPFESVLYLFPLVLLPVATFTFWKRKTIGWILLTIFLTFSAVGAAWLLFQSFKWKPSGLAGLDNLFPRPSPVIYIIQLFLLIGTIYVLCKENIRKVFSINQQTMTATIGISGFAMLVLMLIS